MDKSQLKHPVSQIWNVFATFDFTGLTGTIDNSSLRPTFLLDNALNLLRFKHAHNFVHSRSRSDSLILSCHLRAQAGCGLASREVGAMNTGLGSNDIVVGGTRAKLRGEVI